MDYDNQVENSIVEARRHFLDVKIDDDTPIEHYDLEEEYAKTRKNRSPFIVLSLLGALAFSVLLSWAIVLILDATRKVNPAVIDNFQELRLRDVLNAARQNEQALSEILREIDALKSDRDLKIEKVRSETQAAIQLLTQRRMSVAQRNAQTNTLNRQLQSQVKAIEDEYSAKIRELEEKKAGIEATIQSYQSRLSESDRRRQLVLRSAEEVSQRRASNIQSEYSQRLQQLENQSRNSIEAERAFHQEYVKLSEERHAEEIRETILRYNPNITEPQILDILALDLPSDYERPELSAILEKEGVWTAQEYRLTSQRWQQFETLWARLRAIPYENSVPAVLDQLRRLQLSRLQLMDEVWQAAAKRLIQKNEAIAELEETVKARDEKIAALSDDVSYRDRVLGVFLESIAEAGYVYRIFSPQSIQLRLKTGTELTVGQTLRVRLNQEDVGLLEVVRVDDGVWARVQSLVRQNRPIRILDRVIVVPPAAP